MHEEVIYVDINNFEKYIKNGFKFKGELTTILELNSKTRKIVFSNDILHRKNLRALNHLKVASMLAKISSESRRYI